MTNYDKNYQEILLIITEQRRRKFLLQLAKGALYSFGAVFLLICLASILDIIFEFEPVVRTGILLAIAVNGAVLFLALVLLPSLEYWTKRGKYSVETIAIEMGQKFNELHDDLINALQVYKATQKNKEKYSLELIGYALHSIVNIVKGIKISGLYATNSVKRAGRFFLSPVLFGVLAIGIFPVQFKSGLNHILRPTTQFKPTPVEGIVISPGNITKVEGDSCIISTQIDGVFNQSIALSLKEDSREVAEVVNIEPDSNRAYHHTVINLRTPIRYFVRAEDKVSDVYTIQVERRPFVQKLRIRLDFPQYTELPFRYQEDNVGDITALIGTRVRLQVNANKELKTARLVFNNVTIRNMKVSGDKATADFTLRNGGTYEIILEDEFGYLNLNPIEYVIKTLEDQYPVVEITSPGKDVDLTEELKLPLSVEAEDDFGFSNLRIGYRVESSLPITGMADTTYNFIKLSTEGKQDTKLLVNYLWDLVDLKMMPEDIVFYFAEVWDNDKVSGPKRSISRVYTARFPSIYEIFEETARGDEENVEKLEEVLNESQDLKNRLDEISRELKQQQQMDWLKKQDIEEVAQKQQNLQKSVDDIRKELEEMVERLDNNQMLSIETLKKYQELQQLFQEIMTPELQKALEELRKAAEEFNENKLKQALNKLQLAQDNLLKNLERSINLLKRLQLEQRLDQATKLTENLSERQKALNEQLKDSTPQDIADMLHQQQKLGDDTQSLNEMLSQLDQDLEQQAQFQSETMDSLLNEIQKVMQDMKSSQQSMQQGKMQQAAKQGQMTEQDLQNMLQQMQQLKKSFMQQQKQEFTEQFSRASSELLRLSQSQEGLMEQTKDLSQASPQMGQVAESQQQQLQHLGGITDQLYQLSQQTFFVTPEIGQAIGKSMSGMQRALQQLEQRNSRGASSQQAVALGGLNEAIMNIQDAMQQMQGSSSGVGFEEFMKRMNQMAGKQQGLNQQTLQMGMQQGQMTMQQQAAMARLAAEQEALRKSMEQLQSEFGNRSEITGRLDGITKEMEKVVEDFQGRKVDPRTINRQKRILSRLLDAQRSMQQRDYSRQREARSGKTYFLRSPNELDEKTIQQKERFLEDLIRARKVGFSSDYLELIRSYFQALTEQEQR